MSQGAGSIIFLLGFAAFFTGVYWGTYLLIGVGLVLYAVGHYYAEPQYYTNPDHGDIDE